MVATASTGKSPTALSLESITASVPSRMALATSLTSARVGRGQLTIESSIWVAVITGMPRLLALRISSFCSRGTSSAGISTPRSPRATITPSQSSRMSSIWSMASNFSILATTGVLAPWLAISSLISSRSEGLRTKLRATQSTSCCRPKARSVLSLSVRARIESCTSGKFTPLLLERTPPTVTRHCRVWLGWSTSTTTISTRPSSSRMRLPFSTSSANFS